MSPHLSPASWRGQPCTRLTLPGGDSLLVAEQGAQVLSWVSGGRERLYLSPGCTADGQTAIRGGVPICWPQFSRRGPLKPHGFARNLPWRLGVSEASDGHATLSLHLSANAQTRAEWPHGFELAQSLRLAPGQLRVTLDVHNTDSVPWSFTGALHTYLAVADVAQAQLAGLGGQREWDSLSQQMGQGAETIVADAPFDRVYEAAPASLTLREQAHGMTITQSASWQHTVVWNPGVELPDLPGEGFRHMLCVEAAQVLAPHEVEPGGHWSGWQQLDVLGS